MGILFFVSVLGYAIGIKTLIPKVRAGAALLTSVCCMVFLAYLLIILFGLYRFGAYFVMLLGFLCGAAGICMGIYTNKKNGRSFKALLNAWLHDYCTPSTVIFLLLSVGAAVSLYGMQTFPSHDNYSFWGRAVREMWVFDSSYFNSSSNIAHNDYCAAIPALQYSVVRVFGWRVEYLCYVLVAIIASGFAAVYDRFTWKNKWSVAFGVMLSLVLYPLASTTYDFDELLIDGPLAMLFASVLLLWNEREDDSFASFLPIVAAAFVLVTTKLYIGLLLAVILLVVVAIHWLRNRAAMHIAPVLIMAALILFAQVSWSAHYNHLTNVREHEIKISQRQYLGMPEQATEEPEFSLSYLFKGNPRNSSLSENLDTDVIRSNFEAAKPFVLEVFTKRLDGAYLPVVTMFSVSLLTFIAMAFSVRLASKALRKRIKRCYLLTFISAAAYFIGMMITILVVQPGAAQSTIRYMGIALVVAQNVLAYYLVCIMIENKKLTLEIAAVVVTVIPLLISPQYLLDTYTNEESYYTARHAQSALDSVEHMIDDGDRVLYVENRNPKEGFISTSGVIYCYQFYSFPNYSTAIYHPFGKDYSLSPIDSSRLEKTLAYNRSNKLVVMTDDQEYRTAYAELLGIDPSVSQPWVFSVHVENGDFSYTLIEPVCNSDNN